MGNDNSKSTIENQQLIMQLQQQLINQQNQQQTQRSYQQLHQQQLHQPQQQHQQPQQQHHQPTSQSMNNDIYNRQLPVISPAELSNNIRNNRPPHQSQHYQQTLSVPGDSNNTNTNTKNGTQK